MGKAEPRISVPAPAFRPGDTPDFSKLGLPRPGHHAKPDILAEAAEIRDLAFGLVGVLDEKANAVGDWAPEIAPEELRAGLKTMVLTREYDNRMLKMQRTKRLSFYMKSLGEEAVSIAATQALADEDMLFPSYRQQGALIQRGAELVDMMCHCISNSRDNLKGRQLPVHYTRKDLNWFSVSGNLGTQFPQAVGWSMASALKGETAIACSWIGDGTTAEGDFHAAMTLASTYNAPVVLNVANNQWAISMHNSISGGKAASFAAKAIGYGIPGIRVDGNDYLAVAAVTQWAAERARNGGGPTLIESYTYRGEAHSTSDDPSRYRPKDEYEAWPLGDPVERLRAHLIKLGEWDADQHENWVAEAKQMVSDAWKEALTYGTLEEGPHAPVPTMFEDVFTAQPWHLRRQRQELGV
ncbi:MAG: 3-methyl-2-oxobutanoate dehydrogenase (2-methylpropanoyl-transferring) subunit alpha [Hyphomonadaceae bacterium]|nr:3-methyl-2-oxobutanoate dehydrogenase (2-methylpropanoyl-transferring) subunit alpha [Hyphomonadaceae bacterium]